MLQLTTLLSKDSQTHESQYVCPRCGRRYSTFDAAALLSPDGMSFQCLDCGSALQEETNSGVDENGEEKAKYARLIQQVDPIVRAMKAVDNIHVPENTFNIALANAIPPFDDAETSADYPNLAPTLSFPAANDIQTTTTAGQAFKVDFSEIEEGRSADEIAKRTAQQAQNALPVWHTQSTVSGELTHAGSRQTEIQPDYVSSFSRIVEDEEKKNKEKIKADALDVGWRIKLLRIMLLLERMHRRVLLSLLLRMPISRKMMEIGKIVILAELVYRLQFLLLDQSIIQYNQILQMEVKLRKQLLMMMMTTMKMKNSRTFSSMGYQGSRYKNRRYSGGNAIALISI